VTICSVDLYMVSAYYACDEQRNMICPMTPVLDPSQTSGH
jgi:hypothetical protein